MKLEEALPHYRDGKTIVSNDGSKYNTNIFGDTLCITAAGETEILGEWTILEELPRKMSPALCRGLREYYLSSLFETKEEAMQKCSGDFHSWPALDGNGQPITVFVPEVRG